MIITVYLENFLPRENHFYLFQTTVQWAATRLIRKPPYMYRTVSPKIAHASSPRFSESSVHQSRTSRKTQFGTLVIFTVLHEISGRFDLSVYQLLICNSAPGHFGYMTNTSIPDSDSSLESRFNVHLQFSKLFSRKRPSTNHLFCGGLYIPRPKLMSEKRHFRLMSIKQKFA